MAQKTKAQLKTAIDALYLDCGKECITFEDVNAFEKDKVDSYAGQVIDITKAALIAAIAASEVEIGTRYRITNATGGVVWVWGVDANVISSNAVKEGTWDGSTLTAGSFGNYDLANDRFISGGQYTPTVTATGFDSASSVASQYSIQGNVMTSTHNIEVINETALVTTGTVAIPPPTGAAIVDEEFSVIGVITFGNFTLLSNVQDVLIRQQSGNIEIVINSATAISVFQFTIVVQSKLA